MYNAVGLVAFDLYQYFDFESWFQSHLVNELLITDKRYYVSVCSCFICALFRYQIVRRRVLWLMGCWVGVKFNSIYHPALYRCVISTLGPTEDTVVCYTSCNH